MKEDIELQQVIYNILALQIRFGTYHFADHLPTMEDAGKLFSVSVDTVRSAYLLLKKNGYINLTRKGGATVRLNYDEKTIEHHIQIFFSKRRLLLEDVSYSLCPLLCCAQWISWKHMSPKMLEDLEHFARLEDILPIPSILYYMQSVYGNLKNDMLMRLVLQIFLFLHAPLFSVPVNARYFPDRNRSLTTMVDLCRRQDWTALYTVIENSQKRILAALNEFCDGYILSHEPDPDIHFVWSAYKKSSQVCYTLGMDLLTDISTNVYPAESFLPSLEALAKEKHVSVSTVRRTLSLLGSMGIIKSLPRRGTQILPLQESLALCDYTAPVVRRRLFDFGESLHLFSLSCRCTTCETIAVLDSAAVTEWKNEIAQIKQEHRYDMIVYLSLQLTACHSPHQTVRIVYAEALQQLFWGYPLKNMQGDREQTKTAFLPYIEDLERYIDIGDADNFASRLEELLLLEMKAVADFLTEHEISGADDLFI